MNGCTQEEIKDEHGAIVICAESGDMVHTMDVSEAWGILDARYYRRLCTIHSAVHKDDSGTLLIEGYRDWWDRMSKMDRAGKGGEPPRRDNSNDTDVED